jgi:membrane-bound metal-dependent hydrolase YbcI (DUF457 family)
MDPLAHAAVGVMVKPLAPKAPLWALVAATQVPDLLSFAFMATGIEHGAVTQLDFGHGLQYLSPPLIPWSHGFFMSVVWSAIVAAMALLFFRDPRTSLLIGLMPLGHWVLDFSVYRYMPVFFDNSLVTGLGLITSLPGFIAGLV